MPNFHFYGQNMHRTAKSDLKYDPTTTFYGIFNTYSQDYCHFIQFILQVESFLKTNVMLFGYHGNKYGC